MKFLIALALMTETQTSYNQTAEAYSQKTASFHFLHEMDQFTSSIPAGGSILDLGCGAGRDAKYFCEKGFCVTCVDFSEALLALAKKAAPNASFHLQNFEDLSNFAPHSFDGIWANASLLHLSKQNLPSLLSQLRSLLKPEGALFISLKIGEGEGLEADNRYGGVPKYYSYYQEEEIRTLVQEAGYVITSSHLDSSSGGSYQTHPFYQIIAKNPAR